MGHQEAWDRRRWRVTTACGAVLSVETEAQTTWVLLALIAVGAREMRPVDGPLGGTAAQLALLRTLGLEILELPPDASGRAGFRLGCLVEGLP